MSEIEKAVLKSITSNLNNSLISGWESGDLKQWASFAEQMKVSIKAAVNSINAIVNLKEEDKNKGISL